MFLYFPAFEISIDMSPGILSSGGFNLQISPSKEFSTCLAVFISSISFCFLISISGYIPHPFVHVAYTLNTLAELFYIPSLIIPASLLCLTLCLLYVFGLVSGHGALL